MDQSRAPLVGALAEAEAHPTTGFGAPGHGHGAFIPRRVRPLTGAKAFKADLLTLKGVEDRTESQLALFRAQELAADAWGAEFARLATGGSTQGLHTVLAAVARSGDTVLIAQNAHKAEWAHALACGLDAAPIPVQIDREFDAETVVAPETLDAALAAYPRAKAALVVSPNYYGMTCDVAALARVAHARGVPLIVDAAWGGAFAFSDRLPPDALAAGADAQVCSVHKTMGALGQGSVILARGGLVDLQRLALAYELFETTSPSVPILASLDGARRDHALRGGAIWGDTLDRAADARERIAAIPGLKVWGPKRLAPGCALDASKILIDLSELDVAGYAADDWLHEEHDLAVGLSEARHLLAVVSPGTTARQLRKLERGLSDLSERVRGGRASLPPASSVPRIGALAFDRAMPAADALFAEVEEVAYEEAAGRIAAEMVAPAPPGIPRLVPGQLITAAHRDWLVANRDAGMFVLDPTDPSERRVRVVRGDAAPQAFMLAGAEA